LNECLNRNGALPEVRKTLRACFISSACPANFMQKEDAEKAATRKAKEQSEKAIDMFRKMKKEGLMD